jgi:hypothetical protein
MFRWQWEFLGRSLGFSQSDFGFSPQAAATFSLAAARVRGPYTRFSTEGGGQLDGFEAGGEERYTLEQWQQGFAWKFAGWSVQQEYHEKRIEDHEAGARSTLRGGYAQLGRAWPADLGARSVPLELALRYAAVGWEGTPRDRRQLEFSLVGNLFLDGHENKLSAELSRLELSPADGAAATETRLRFQWDVSF